jgi:hypothetical protein
VEKEVEFFLHCKYRNHVMRPSELTATRVGNSRGVRLPVEVLRRYHIGETLKIAHPARAPGFEDGSSTAGKTFCRLNLPPAELW